MAKVKVNYMRDNMTQIKNQLQRLHYLQGHNYATEITRELKSELNKTLLNGNKGFNGAMPKAISQVNNSLKGGVEVEVRVFMSYNNTNERHYIWHIINSGRQPKGGYPQAFAKKIIRYPLYNGGARTTPGSLNVKPFAGYSGEWRTFKAGQAMPGIKAREWYKALLRELIKKHKLRKYRGWAITRTEVENG